MQYTHVDIYKYVIYALYKAYIERNPMCTSLSGVSKGGNLSIWEEEGSDSHSKYIMNGGERIYARFTSLHATLKSLRGCHLAILGFPIIHIRLWTR